MCLVVSFYRGKILGRERSYPIVLDLGFGSWTISCVRSLGHGTFTLSCQLILFTMTSDDAPSPATTTAAAPSDQQTAAIAAPTTTPPPPPAAASSSTKLPKDKVPFPVGPAGKRELRLALKATTNPALTIQEFQESHSLHTMTAKAFRTVPAAKYKNTRKNQTAGALETLDSDSVMTFLSHLGVRQHEVHKRVSDALLQHLCDEIRKTEQNQQDEPSLPLLDLLQACWVYSTTISELRPVLWALLKQLGAQTPLAVLIALTEREDDDNDNNAGLGALRHAEIFRPLPLSLKRMCWEADWDNRIVLPAVADPTLFSEPLSYLNQVRKTILYETVHAHVEAYLHNAPLCAAANRTYCLTVSERRIVTTQRRALTKSTTITAAGPDTAALTSGKAVSHLRNLLCDTSYRPKLLCAILSMLMAKHGSCHVEFLGGSHHLHCTLVADLLLSAGGPLPKAYTDVLTLTRVLDDMVQEANVSNASLAKIQAVLKLIFQPDPGDTITTTATASLEGSHVTTMSKPCAIEYAPTTSVLRQMNRLITEGLTSMKENDPQQLFLNPVTDAIAPGYSHVIKQPMSIVTMEQKVDTNAYNSISEWEIDVKLMYKNCIDYNRGAAGQWFRSEANRQAKIFREEIFSKAKRLYQNEISKRKVSQMSDISSFQNNENKRSKTGPDMSPLDPSTKKRKKDKEEHLPSMPALAAMLLSDPFVVRLLLARVLRELRQGVIMGQSLPCAHAVVPSILQILQIARWSKQICAVKGKKYFIPAVGFKESEEDRIAMASFVSLRRCIPMLVRLLLEAELDRRVAIGGDFYDATQSSAVLQSPPPLTEWDGNEHVPIVAAMMRDSLIQICQPGNKNETSLPVTFPKFVSALLLVSNNLQGDRTFFECLSYALLRHKMKLPRLTRDAIFNSWLLWLQNEGSMMSVAHECLMALLNDWAGLGNILLPRETLLGFVDNLLETVDSTETKQFVAMWTSSSKEFAPVRKQYDRMLAQLPEASVFQWKAKYGIEQTEQETMDVDSAMTVQ